MVNDVFQAIHFEKRIKKWSAAKKRALASDDFDRLKLLSLCQNDITSVFASSDYVPKKLRNKNLIIKVSSRVRRGGRLIRILDVKSFSTASCSGL